MNSRMRGLTDASELHRPSLHQSGGPPGMPPRAAPSRFDALESAADAGMATPPLAVLLAVALHGQRCPRSQEPLRPHSARGPIACPGCPERKTLATWMPKRGCFGGALCCSPKLTHLATAFVPQDTVRRHLRSANSRGCDCVAPQKGLQRQRRRRTTAARYRGG